MLFSGKLNKLRTIALGLVLLGFLIMYLGYMAFAGWFGSFFEQKIMIFGISIIIGFLLLIGSSVMYMWLGIISSKAVQVYCPKCKKVTKIVGLRDECMFCKQKLSIDPKDAPQNQENNENNEIENNNDEVK